MDQHHQHHHHHHNNLQSSNATVPPAARLCHIIKWDDFDGYGFNLHAEKGRQGQFIGKVDEGSPSEAAGLRQGDRIIEVNEINISNESHKQVVERIKAFAGETKLLVVDQVADDYYKANNLPIKGGMIGVVVSKTPDKSPTQLLQEERDAALAAAAAAAHQRAKQPQQQQQHSTNGSADHQMSTNNEPSPMTTDATDTDGTNNHSNHQENGKKHSKTGSGSNASGVMDEDATSTKSSSSSSSKPEKYSPQSNGGGGGGGGGSGNNGTSSAPTLNLAMSAKELRAKLAQRKKYDPKKESLGFKDKFDIVQKL